MPWRRALGPFDVMYTRLYAAMTRTAPKRSRLKRKRVRWSTKLRSKQRPARPFATVFNTNMGKLPWLCRACSRPVWNVNDTLRIHSMSYETVTLFRAPCLNLIELPQSGGD